MTKFDLIAIMSALIRAQIPEPTDETDTGEWRTEYSVSQAFDLYNELTTWMTR